jgi:hypothetical protein
VCGHLSTASSRRSAKLISYQVHKMSSASSEQTALPVLQPPPIAPNVATLASRPLGEEAGNSGDDTETLEKIEKQEEAETVTNDRLPSSYTKDLGTAGSEDEVDGMVEVQDGSIRDEQSAAGTSTAAATIEEQPAGKQVSVEDKQALPTPNVVEPARASTPSSFQPIPSSFVRSTTPSSVNSGSRTGTPPPLSDKNSAPKKFRSININEKFLKATSPGPGPAAPAGKLGSLSGELGVPYGLSALVCADVCRSASYFTSTKPNIFHSPPRCQTHIGTRIQASRYHHPYHSNGIHRSSSLSLG